MARLTANSQFDMSTFFNEGDLAGFFNSAEVIEGTSTRLVLRDEYDGIVEQLTLTGTFGSYVDGYPTTGIVTGAAYYLNGALFSFSNASISVQDFTDYVLDDDLEGLFSAMLGGDDRIAGSAAGDVLFGFDGNDIMDGVGGTDHLFGGGGNDRFYVNSSADQIYEYLDEGVDTVYSTAGAYTLAGGPEGNVENLVYTGASAFNGVGNGLNNSIIGGSGNDRLNGSAGADRLHGGLGNDVYYADNGGDRIYESASGGTDTIYSSVTMALALNVERLTLTGSSAITGFGNELANIITGNAVANGLRGGLGNDRLYGSGGADVINGEDGNDIVDGGLGDDLLYGGAGNDQLVGRGGADQMRGGLGNDIYYVDDTGDRVAEALGEGVDQLGSYLASYTLGANIENGFMGLRTGGRLNGNALNNALEGNIGNDVMAGGSGNDTVNGLDGEDILDGGIGNDNIYGGNGADKVYGGAGDDSIYGGYLDLTKDTLAGGAGNDTYYFSSGGDGDDRIVETADGGIDTVIFTHTYFYALPDFVENAFISATFDDESNNLVGNDLDNHLKTYGIGTIEGRGGNDVLEGGSTLGATLEGGAGDDILFGMWGVELEGGTGHDSFILTGPAEKILDLESGETIDLRQLDADSTRTGIQAFQWENGSNNGQKGILSIVNAGGGVYHLVADRGGTAPDLNLEVHVLADDILSPGDVLL